MPGLLSTFAKWAPIGRRRPAWNPGCQPQLRPSRCRIVNLDGPNGGCRRLARPT